MTDRIARRVEYLTCPKCGEVLPMERDKDNMSSLPTCGCGHKTTLGDMLGQMRKAMEHHEPRDPPGWEGGFAENH